MVENNVATRVEVTQFEVGREISLCGWLNAVQSQADQLGEMRRIC